MGIVVGDVERVFAHDDPEVVLRLCEKAVRVDEPESVLRFERVPLVDVAVNEHGAFVAMRVESSRCACDRVVDGALRARVIQVLPRRRNEVGEPTSFLGAGRQTAVRRRPPDARHRGTEDLVAPADRQTKLVQRWAEPFEQERAACRIVSQQSHTPFAASQSQDCDLVLGRVTATRHKELQHRGGAVFACRFRDESLCRVGVGVTDCDVPVVLQVRDKQRQVVEPCTGTDRERLLADDFGNGITQQNAA
jgi:hypothetical protein